MFRKRGHARKKVLAIAVNHSHMAPLAPQARCSSQASSLSLFSAICTLVGKSLESLRWLVFSCIPNSIDKVQMFIP